MTAGTAPSVIGGMAVQCHDLLLELLPASGDWLSRDAAMTALGERLAQDLTKEEFDRCIWQLGQKVVWSPHENLLRRQVAGDAPELPSQVACERDLEGWFELFLWKHAPTMLYDPLPRSFSLVVQNTARIALPAGRWTRPDLCMACISRFQYAPLPNFDLFSFELKIRAGCNVLAVHEALAHTATAHFSYLSVYLPEDSAEAANLPAMLEQAQRHGVGVIRISNPQHPASYCLLLAARRYNPPPAKLDGFIEDRFDEANRLALRKWVRR
jgi:hypothetical protein